MKDGHCNSLDFMAYIKHMTKGFLYYILSIFIWHNLDFTLLIFSLFSKIAFSDAFYLFKFVRYFVYTSAYLDERSYVRSFYLTLDGRISQ